MIYFKHKPILIFLGSKVTLITLLRDSWKVLNKLRKETEATDPLKNRIPLQGSKKSTIGRKKESDVYVKSSFSLI